MDQPPEKTSTSRAALREFLLFFLGTALFLALAIYFDLTEMIATLINQEYDARQIDEILLTLAVVGFAASMYTIHRWRRLQDEISRRSRAEDSLLQANQDLIERSTRLEQRNRQVALLSEMSSLLQASTSQEEAFKVISISIPRLFPGASGSLMTLNASNQYLESVTQWGEIDSLDHIQAENCWALRRGSPFTEIERTRPHLCKHILSSQSAWSMCFPITAKGSTLGVLNLQCSSQTLGQVGWIDSVEPISAAIVDQIGLALSNLQLQDTLRRLAIHDPLTGLFNRRYLEISLEREVYRAIRRQTSLVVMMLDLDHFKDFNDTYGHESGDLILREISSYLLRTTRAEDIVCRYGGEEILIILPEAAPQNALHKAEQICLGIRNLKISQRGRHLGIVTVSIGLALFPEHGTTPEELLKAADNALYQAKHLGRDRVVLASL